MRQLRLTVEENRLKSITRAADATQQKLSRPPSFSSPQPQPEVSQNPNELEFGALETLLSAVNDVDENKNLNKVNRKIGGCADS